MFFKKKRCSKETFLYLCGAFLKSTNSNKNVYDGGSKFNLWFIK